MTYDFQTLFLSWRPGKGHRRILIGQIELKEDGSASFAYLQEGMAQAKKLGLQSYPDFPTTDKCYTENVLRTFANRLNNPARADIQQYYDFWKIPSERIDDKAYLLAHTGAMLPTDNFEILARYIPSPGLSFVSEVCGLSKMNIPSDFVHVDDELRYVTESENEYDPHAVRVYKGDTFLGYVKLVHNEVFDHQPAGAFTITVKSIEKNGHLNRCFIQIQQK